MGLNLEIWKKMSDNQQTPVNDVHCEQIVVGTLLNYSEEWFKNADILSAELFYDWKCCQVFQAAQAVINRGENPDFITVNAEVTKHPERFKNLSLPDIMELSNKVELTDLRYKILRLQELMMRRRLRPIWQRLQIAEQEESIPLAKAQEEAMSKLQDLLTTSSTNIKTLEEVGKDFLVNVIEANRNGTREKGIVTGFKSLDERGAFQLSDMWVIAADSSQGKTSFAEAITLQAAKNKLPTAIYSMEMTATQLYARITAGRVGIPSNILNNKQLTDEQYQRVVESVKYYCDFPISFDERSTSSLDEIISSIRTLHYKKKIKLAVVDYMQILNVNMKSANQEQQMAEAARRFKNLAKELNICIILLSQLSKESGSYGAKPQLNRLRGSGQINEAADGVILLWRPEYYGGNVHYSKPYENVSIKGTAQIKVAKGRNTGTMRFIAGFDANLTKFYDLDQTNLPQKADEPDSKNSFFSK